MTIRGSKMLPCKACCPARPDLGYYKVGRVRHYIDYVEIDGKDVRAWKCDNCRNVKRPRKRDHMSYDLVTKEAATDSKMNRRNKLSFHCFNPNGVYQKLKAVQDRVSKTVDETGVPNGALLVHGIFNDYPRKKLFGVLDKKNASRYEVDYAIRSVNEAIDDAEKWISKTQANHKAGG